MRSVGKIFEQELFKSFRNVGLIPYRITDRTFFAGNRVLSQESEADFWVFSANETLSAALIEAKAVSGKSLPFERLKEHQREALTTFDGYHDNAHAFVAIDFYDKDNRRNFNTAYLVPISVWNEYVEKLEKAGHKSIPIKACEDDERIIKCIRISGGMFDVTGLRMVM